ncbi:hypothetical protein B0O99DRAFT_591906 [Bisporella sp. PMI_857]|nr:hypothetical protein B0O99DRAFT_591906 [Bisporella sp. PMI_857]
MVINPTFLAQRTRQSISRADAQRRVIHSYREWIRAAPDIQRQYSLNLTAAALRTKIRQEFERHRYVTQLGVIDVLLFQSHAEYQGWPPIHAGRQEQNDLADKIIMVICLSSGHYINQGQRLIVLQEMLNYWKQLPHILKYFRAEEDPTARLPQNFMSGFLEGRN